MTPHEERPLPLLAGLIGWPVAQSKSQLIHEFWLRRLGIDGHYIRLPVRPGEVARAFRGMVALGFAGVQATMPHKRACFDLVDHHTPAARALGAVNTVIVEADGSLTGNGGCNAYKATWSLSGSTLALGNLVTDTGATCDATTQGIEQSYFSVIPYLDTAKVVDGKLVLGSSLSSSISFTFAPAS